MRSWIRVERSYSTGGLGCCLMVGLTLLLFEAYPLLAAPLVTYLDRQIISVEVVGTSSQTTVKDLQEALVTRVGDPLSIEQVRDSIFHLFSGTIHTQIKSRIFKYLLSKSEMRYLVN